MGCQEEEAEAQQGSEEAASVTCRQSGQGKASMQLSLWEYGEGDSEASQPWLSALAVSPERQAVSTSLAWTRVCQQRTPGSTPLLHHPTDHSQLPHGPELS